MATATCHTAFGSGVTRLEAEGQQMRLVYRHVTLGCVVAGALASLGSECSPTPPACEGGDCNPETELPACISYCSPKLDHDDAIGEACSDDPCHPEVLSGNVILCPSPLTCFPAMDATSPLGVCLDLNQGLLEECNPDGFDLCQSGTYCRAVDDGEGGGCPGFFGLNGNEAGLCSLPVREGSACDADWGSPGCAVCEPGTLCRPDPHRGGRRLCQRSCESDGDCPCEDTEADTTCQPSGFCGICIGHGSACDYRNPDPEMDAHCEENPTEPDCYEWISNSPYECCDTMDQCVTNAPDPEDGEVYPGECCRPAGASCEPGTFDCCSDAACDPSTNECVACGEFGETPPFVGGEEFCCAGLEFRDDRCLVPCTDGLEGTACEACPGAEGEWKCTDRGDKCDGPATGTTDDCDGIDNDCDHRVDEDFAPSSCEAEVEACGSEFPGTERCIGGEPQCAVDDSTYCRYDFDTSRFYGNLDACGWGMKDCSVNGHADCPPGTFCFINNCWTDSTGMSYYGCWPIDQPHPSGACPGGTYVTENDSCTGSVCWAPGDLGGGYGCP